MRMGSCLAAIGLFIVATACDKPKPPPRAPPASIPPTPPPATSTIKPPPLEPAVPDLGRNAFAYYQAAFDRLATDGASIAKTSIDDLDDSLEKHVEAVAFLRAGVRRPECVWPPTQGPDFPTVMDGFTDRVLPLTALATRAARRAIGDDAAQRYIDLLLFGHQFSNHDGHPGALSGAIVRGRTMSAIRNRLAGEDADPALWGTLKRWLVDEWKPIDAPASIERERSHYQSVLGKWEDRLATLKDRLPASIDFHALMDRDRMTARMNHHIDEMKRRIGLTWIEFHKLPPIDYPHAKGDASEVVADRIRKQFAGGSETRPLDEFRTEISEVYADFMTKAASPPLEKSIDMFALDEARRRLLILALELKDHKHRTGAFPDRLELIPAGQAWLDPFSDRPFIYRRSKLGPCKVWSVGTNGVDDGGDAVELADLVYELIR